MKIKIKIHSNSSQEKIEKISENEFEVWIREKPIQGKANEELIKLLKKYFRKPVKIVFGFNSKIKLIEVGIN